MSEEHHKRYARGYPVYKPFPESERYPAGYCPEHEDPVHDQTTWNIPRVLEILFLAVCCVVILIWRC